MACPLTFVAHRRQVSSGLEAEEAMPAPPHSASSGTVHATSASGAVRAASTVGGNKAGRRRARHVGDAARGGARGGRERKASSRAAAEAMLPD